VTAFVWGFLRFAGVTVGLFVAGMVLYFMMNLVRTVLSAMFVSRRLSDPAYAGPEKTASTAVFESGAIVFFPSWLPAPARLIWGGSGLVTLAVRYAFTVWWPILLLALLLSWRWS